MSRFENVNKIKTTLEHIYKILANLDGKIKKNLLWHLKAIIFLHVIIVFALIAFNVRFLSILNDNIDSLKRAYEECSYE